MASKKRQHYVPQLYLKYFSRDRKNITVFSLKDKRIITKSAPISRQCYENYFYGKAQEIENAISSIEKAAKEVIDKIISSETIPRNKDPDYFTLLVFVLYQHARTLRAAEEINQIVDCCSTMWLKEYIDFKKPPMINKEDVDNFSILLKDPALLKLSVVSLALPVVFDLRCKLIINKTKHEFITSDNPVILYNKYYLNEAISYTGLASKGLLILFPLTPRHYLIYYDSIIYRVGGKYTSVPLLDYQINDIDELNILQLINANKVAFTLSMEEEYLQKIFKIAEKYRINQIEVKETLVNTKYRKGKIIWFRRPEIKYNAQLSFIKIYRKIPKYYKRQMLVRDPYLVSLLTEFMQKVKNKEYKPFEWNRFLKDKISYSGPN